MKLKQTLVLSTVSSALQFVLPTRPLPPPPLQSSAQLCNNNIFSVIFKVLALKDLYAVALTCIGWCLAAYRVLYTFVDFQLSYQKGTQTIDLLSYTLIVSKDIQGLIRDLLLQSMSELDNLSQIRYITGTLSSRITLSLHFIFSPQMLKCFF